MGAAAVRYLSREHRPPEGASVKTLDQTTEEILDLVASEFKIPRGQLCAGDDFYRKLGIDSLDARDLLTHVEYHFGIQLPDHEMQDVKDFRTLAERIQARL
jgi:acyl carrier protein